MRNSIAANPGFVPPAPAWISSTHVCIGLADNIDSSFRLRTGNGVRKRRVASDQALVVFGFRQSSRPSHRELGFERRKRQRFVQRALAIKVCARCGSTIRGFALAFSSSRRRTIVPVKDASSAGRSLLDFGDGPLGFARMQALNRSALLSGRNAEVKSQTS